MSEKKIKVPEGMLEIAKSAVRYYCIENNYAGYEDPVSSAWTNVALPCLQAALKWLAENPIVPNDTQLGSI